jgi:hypothetical protein
LSGVSIDHIVSFTIFIVAVTLFIGLFSQTVQTGVNYQRQMSTAKKGSDLIDTVLLTPGINVTGTPAFFGLQDPTLAQYNLNPFSVMRLNSSIGTPVSYQKSGQTYSNITVGSGNYLLMPYSDIINYTTALGLLGINGTYGFQLSLTPVLNISISEVSPNPLTLSLSVKGSGFPLADAPVSYSLMPFWLTGAYPDFETVALNQTGTVYTDASGLATLQFAFPVSSSLSYAFIAYAHLDGITGLGYYGRASSGNKYTVPFVDSLSAQRILVAHSDDVPNSSNSSNTVFYNSTFAFVNPNSGLQTTPLGNSTVTSGIGNSASIIPMSIFNPGIVAIAYNDNNGSSGVVMAPWGLSSSSFPLTFGGNHTSQSWVSTDVRQVQINGVSYQATLSLWSIQGYQVTR